MDIQDKQKFIFGRLFLLANKLKGVGDRVFEDEMTIRQWLMTVAVSQFGLSPPTLSEVAEVMGSSRQNVKQLALKLQTRGFLNIEEDGKDHRALRLVLSERSYDFWEMRQLEIKNFLAELFEDLSSEEIELLSDSLNKLYAGIFRKGKTL